MPNKAENVNARCPFYQGINLGKAEKAEIKHIVCEGLTNDCTIRLCFHRDGLLTDWLRDHCERYDYATVCPIAAMLESKYDDAQFAKVRKEAGL